MKASGWQVRKLEDSQWAIVLFPDGPTKGLPVLYLLHGEGDVETDWISEEKGRLITSLAESCPMPMLVVLPFGGTEVRGVISRSEPPLEDFTLRLRKIMKSVEREYAPDAKRRAILGISMGGKQALAFVLSEPERSGFSVLGILSGKFQGGNLQAVRDYANDWPEALAQGLALNFHYCGDGPDVPRPQKKALTGDERFLPNNKAVADSLGGKIRIGEKGLHNWNFWRPELQRFIEQLSELWKGRPSVDEVVDGAAPTAT